MFRSLTMPSLIKPFAFVHRTLASFGFTQSSTSLGVVYSCTFRDPATRQSYVLMLPTSTEEKGQTCIRFSEARLTGIEPIPTEVRDAVDDIMRELVQYLQNDTRSARPEAELESMNGYMANNEEELKRLGKVMSSMPTNSQLVKNGLVPDPMQ
ncbi:hypothetical protein [Paenibacillus sp. YYML68]|uniref:hypothetical protein n=1 Tax=Paenibacillus sp. YYML68 TaxID=2909250 RepID=UPI00249174DE|nr:hypothetical protein [Paenibacillus sp. YYML68]